MCSWVPVHVFQCKSDFCGSQEHLNLGCRPTAFRSRVPCKVSTSCMSQAPNPWKPTWAVFLFQPGVTYAHPGQDTSAGLAPSAVGVTNHNLGLFHNNPVASESSSSEILRSMLPAKSVAKRAVAEAAQHDKVPRPVGFVPPPPPCPGRIRHFDI